MSSGVLSAAKVSANARAPISASSTLSPGVARRMVTLAFSMGSIVRRAQIPNESEGQEDSVHGFYGLDGFNGKLKGLSVQSAFSAQTGYKLRPLEAKH